MAILNTLQFVTGHPLTRRHKAAALMRFAQWQASCRLSPGAIAVPFVNDARLLVRRGMTGATGNVYAGLHEFEDMAFVLHMLRPEDLFVDVGANVGSYTVLAGKAVGARCVAAEPVASTYRDLRDNINLNELQERVDARQVAIGRDTGTLQMTTGFDSGNHVATGAPGIRTETVDVLTLDELVGSSAPTVLKIDVEGFESEVLAGASRTLANEAVAAILMETNECARRYGRSESASHGTLIKSGYQPYSYDPRTRYLIDLQGGYNLSANTLYLRDWSAVQARLREAPAFEVLGQRI